MTSFVHCSKYNMESVLSVMDLSTPPKKTYSTKKVPEPHPPKKILPWEKFSFFVKIFFVNKCYGAPPPPPPNAVLRLLQLVSQIVGLRNMSYRGFFFRISM